MTFREIATAWFEDKEKSLKPVSLEAYKYALSTTILPALGDLEEVTAQDIDALKATMAESGVKTSSFRNYFNIIRSIQRYGADRGWCRFPTWPSGLQSREYRSDKQPVLLTPLQEMKLAAHLISTPAPRHLGILLTLSFGLRLGEICTLQWSAVDLEKGFLNVIEGPGKLRRIPIPQEMFPILGHCSQGKPASTYVCTGTTEPLLTPKTLRDSLKAVCKKLDLPFLKFQDLRHNFTVRCIRSGCDFVTLMHLLGYTRAQALYDDYKDFFPADAPAAMSAQAQALLG